MTVSVGVLRESSAGERRVALVPDSVRRLAGAGFDVLVEAGAGAAAWFDDGAYAEAGAQITSRAAVSRDAAVLVGVGPPDDAGLRRGQVLAGLLSPQRRPDLVARWAELGVTAISLDRLPRTLSRAQSMDALTSQANIAGYRAAVLAAATYGGFFPMLVTAAGTSRPAAVLVLGAGVAGLQAIGTARRLGAVVTAYDVRPESRSEVESVGARFLDLPEPVAAGGAGGYARALTDEERQAQQVALDEQVSRFEVVITTAQVPGGRPPVLITAECLKGLHPGAVVVDVASGPDGGNVEGSQPDRTVVTDNGVTVIGAGHLPSDMAPAASTAYARNVEALLTHLCPHGSLAIDLADEVTGAVVLTHEGVVR